MSHLRNGLLQVMITDSMTSSPDFKESVDRLQTYLELLGKGLAEHSAPFYSPRYNAHMNTDISSTFISYTHDKNFNVSQCLPLWDIF